MNANGITPKDYWHYLTNTPDTQVLKTLHKQNSSLSYYQIFWETSFLAFTLSSSLGSSYSLSRF